MEIALSGFMEELKEVMLVIVSGCEGLEIWPGKRPNQN
jgi:hypothetical protein